jgi:TRAP-type mannitol/chloroaromatic compound transport system substrate-binding protein
MRLGLNRAAKYYYFPGWHEPGTEFELMINSQAWAQLPEDLQLMVETAAAAVSEWIYTQMEFHNQAALKELRTKKNIEVLEFPPEVLAELKRLTRETLDEEASNNAKFKRIYDAYTGFSESYKDWSKMSDEAYQKALRE